jgi:hypothetical protein
MKRSEQINELVTALSKARGEMGVAIKDTTNTHFRSKYADLNSYLNACIPVLSKHGLFVSQIPSRTENGLELVTIIFHTSGQSIESYLPINVKSDGRINELQAFGSVLSYLKRYALSSMLGMASDDDDDGNSAKDYKANQPKTEPAVVPVPFVNAAQLSTLRSSMAQCGNEFVTKVMEWLATKGIMSLDKMPITLFEVVKKRIDSHLASDEIQDAIVGEV